MTTALKGCNYNAQDSFTQLYELEISRNFRKMFELYNLETNIGAKKSDKSTYFQDELEFLNLDNDISFEKNNEIVSLL